MRRESLVFRFLKKAEKPGKSPFFKAMNVLMNASLSLYGEKVINKLTRAYPDYRFILIPSRSAGDMYFLKYGFDELVKKAKADRHLLIVDSASCAKSAEGLGYDNLYPVGMLKQKSLVVYQRTHIGRDERIINAYPWCMFDRKDAVKGKLQGKAKTCQKDRGAYATGKIILSPYERSITELGLKKLPTEFWEKLAEELKKRGYQVFTNCSGSAEEPVIRHTSKIFPKYSEIEEVVEEMGNCISVRSGFSDFVSDANARKLVLYPTKGYLNSWSLYRVKEVQNCREIVYGDYEGNEAALIRDIGDFFTNK